MSLTAVSVRWIRILPLMLPLLVGGLFLSTLSVWEPYWQTNDDVGIAMRVEGLGSIASPSRNLIFSNALWGVFVHCMPSVGGVLGYSLATYLVLLAAALASCHFLVRRGLELWTALAAMLSVFFYPFIFPQFTVGSGLAGLAAVLALLDYRERHGHGALLLCLVLVVASYLIRWNEFIFIAGISLPLWISFNALRDRALLALVLTSAVASVAALAFDRASHSDVSWVKHSAFNAVRVKLTDYGLADYLKTLPQGISNNLSSNDFDLLRNWFFVDDNLTSVQTLEQLRKAAPNELSAPHSFAKGIASVRSAWQDQRAFPLASGGAVHLHATGQPASVAMPVPVLRRPFLHRLSGPPGRLLGLLSSAWCLPPVGGRPVLGPAGHAPLASAYCPLLADGYIDRWMGWFRTSGAMSKGWARMCWSPGAALSRTNTSIRRLIVICTRARRAWVVSLLSMPDA